MGYKLKNQRLIWQHLERVGGRKGEVKGTGAITFTTGHVESYWVMSEMAEKGVEI